MLARLLLLILACTLVFEDAAAASRRCAGSSLVQGPCLEVRGTLQWWRRLPPFLRIESGDLIYGIWPPEHENVPKVIKELAPYSTRGVYLLCPLNQVARVPYDERPIELYCIEKAKINEREIKINRRIVWRRLPTPRTAYN